ncbi:MAG: histidine kinase, partial [Cyclobacteriaceae bacterium]|nr:histidine kinase [Cyclobacteriaceae bacterium]
EVSVDLIEEMHEEMASGNTEEVKAITNDIKQNLDKINHHGKRASSIVKGMLEHSRTSDSQKVLTDLNDLADEYLRLAYHGLRAKDKSFNADFKLDLEKDLPKINVISQDIGRVLLNLINNAFYAVSKKFKGEDETYKPEVIVSSKLISPSGGGQGEVIQVSVKDNGPGIPKEIKDKIFQPFFTTKPTGQGTGLGLSLAYDIITKGHDGHLEVETEEGIGTEFIIYLSIV